MGAVLGLKGRKHGIRAYFRQIDRAVVNSILDEPVAFIDPRGGTQPSQWAISRLE